MGIDKKEPEDLPLRIDRRPLPDLATRQAIVTMTL